MKVILWNIKGMNNLHKKDLLKNIFCDHKPDILLIQETKMQIDKLEALKSFLFKDCGFHGVSFDGASGGVATFWNAKLLRGIIVSNGFNHVETKFTCPRDSYSCVISNVYAPNLKRNRKKLWDDLSNLRLIFLDLPWLVMGYFKTLLYDDEKVGGSQADPESRFYLRMFINDNALLDVKLSGANFTW